MEMAYIKVKGKMAGERNALEQAMKVELDEEIKMAVDAFIKEKVAATLDLVGPSDLLPFIMQITQEAADFTSWAARIEVEYSDFKMQLQTTGVLQ